MDKKITSLAFISSSVLVLVKFRGELLKKLVGKGVKVYVLAPDFAEKDKNEIKKMGAIPIDYSLKRTGLNPWQDLKSLVELYSILRKLQIDIILTNFIKPVIYGSWAAHLAGIKRKFSLISGLGYIYTENPENISYKRLFLRTIVSRMYKSALGVNEKVFFQNPDDQNTFIEKGIVAKEKTRRLHGSGVDLTTFYFCSPVHSPLKFIFVGRFLKEKGIYELFEAFKSLKKNYPDTRLLVLGDVDENQGSISREEVNKLVEEGLIEWPGRVDDVREWIKDSSVFVLPSWREGTPRSGLEAMAMGRPILTNEVPGCRETVFLEEGTTGERIKIGKNGILTQPRDSMSLREGMEFFINNPYIIKGMGQESRKIAEELYDVHKVNEAFMKELFS